MKVLARQAVLFCAMLYCISAYAQPDDVVGPEIIYSKLLTTSQITNISVTAQITDMSGVDNSTSVPKLYYRKSLDENIYNDNSSDTPGWKYSTGSPNGDAYTFEIDYSKINGGVKAGDEIEYFIIAQDLSLQKNISVSSGSFSQYPSSTDLTADNFPIYDAERYRIAELLSGSYYVGDWQEFSSLTGEYGFFDYMMKNIISGDINIYITSDIYENYSITLGKLVYEGGIHNVTIGPDYYNERTIYGDAGNAAVIKFNGVDNITIDGSYNGSGRYLNFTNTSYMSPRAVIMIGSNYGQGGNNITIQNCNIYNSEKYPTSIGIVISDSDISEWASSSNLNNLTIRNNNIFRSQIGILAHGGYTDGQFLYNLLIEDNLIGHDNDYDQIYQFGIDVQNAPNAMIRRNKIWNISNDASEKWGIQIGNSTPTEGVICDGNKISKIRYTGSYGGGAYGINIVNGDNHKIVNNMISDIKTDRYSPTSTTYNPFGIRIAGGNNHRIWHNTINMTGYQEGWNSDASLTANIIFISNSMGMDIRGNILHNSLEGISGTRSFNIFVNDYSVVNAFSQLNNNVYSVGGEAGVVGGFGTNLPFNEAYNLSEWQSMTSLDQNSIEGFTEFVNNDEDLHLNGNSIGNPTFMYNGMSEVQNDGDGEMRNATTYFGADEVNAIFELVEDTKIEPNQAMQCVDNQVTVSFSPEVTNFADGIKRNGLADIIFQWYKNGELIESAVSNNLTFYSVQMIDSARYYATGTFLDQTVVGSEILLSVETPMSLTMQPVNVDVCTTDPVLVIPTVAFGTIQGYQWEFKKAGNSDWTEINGQITPTLIMNMDYDLVGDYRLKLIGPGNCGSGVIYSDESNVMFSEPLTDVVIYQTEESAGKDLNKVCSGEDIILNVTHTGSVFGYRWQKDVGYGFEDLLLFKNPTAHSQTLRIENSTPDDNGIYRCMVLGSAECGTGMIPSQSVTVKIWDNFSLDQQPENRILCLGDDSSIKVEISGEVYSYQWYKNGEMLTVEDSEFFDKPVFHFKDATFENSGLYQCRIHAEDCINSYDVMSDAASVYVITGTEIIIPPFTQAVMIGGDVNFRVKTHINGAPENYKPLVQWYRGAVPLIDGGRFIGTKSDRLMIHNVQESDFGEDYRVVVTGHCGSAEAKNFGLLKGEIIITQQPVSIDGCQDDEITLSVRANTIIPGEYLTYQWYKNGQPLTDDNCITGSKENDLVISPAKSPHSGNYYAIVKTSNSVIGLSTVEATVRIEATPLITVQPEENVTLTVGEVLSLAIEAVGDNLIYQWYFEGTAIANEDLSTLMISNVTESNSGKYYCEISNSCGLIKSVVSDVIITTTASDVIEVAESGYSLGIASPNPAQIVSGVSYVTPVQSHIRITLINELGAEVAVLTDGIINAGQHNLNIDVEKLNLTSGIYSIVLKSSGVMISQRLVVIR